MSIQVHKEFVFFKRTAIRTLKRSINNTEFTINSATNKFPCIYHFGK